VPEEEIMDCRRSRLPLEWSAESKPAVKSAAGLFHTKEDLAG